MEGLSVTGSLKNSLSFLILIVLISLANIALLLQLEKNGQPLEIINKCWFYTLSGIWSMLVLIGIYHGNYYLVEQGYLSKFRPLRVKGDVVYIYLCVQAIFVDGIVLLLQNFIIIQHRNNTVQLENLRLNTARSEAAYQLLLQQIHPHFLFNALNILKSLIKRSPERAEDYLMRLSDFLRVSVSGNKRGLASLDNEIKLCIDYLEMQKVRFGEALCFSFDIAAENKEDAVLPVFSLQPLLENAIKHNELTVAEPLTITIVQKGGWIMVSNNIQLRSVAEYSTGSGLANLAERYRLLSGDEVEIMDDGIRFSVSLKILNDENYNHRR